jgi:ribosomal protein S18 acetylase RimI-like enzyme
MYSWDTTAAMALRQELGIPKNAFVTVYAGNIGFASNAEMLVDVFAKLNERSQIYLVIAGDGSRLGACQAQVKINHLGRVLIHSPWKTEETGPVLQMADVLLLPTKGRQSLNSIPSKLIAYFLSGRPVIGAVLPESDTGIAILESGAGWVVDPDSVDLIAEAIVAASELSTERLSQMGSAGRKYALQNHMRESNLARVIHIVEQAARPRSREGRESRGSDFVPVSKQNGYGIDVDLRIVRANHSHLDSIVRIHLAAFEGFFLESLGKRFLRELYRGFLVEPSGVCLVAIDRENVVGFVAGTTQPEGFFRILLRSRWLEFLCAGAASLTMHPLRVGKKFLSALSYQGKRPVDVPNAALLSSIGVAPSRKGSGIGKILISAFCEKAYASGAYTVYLTTDRDKNDAVNQFYLSNGFKLHSSFLKERKRWMNLYIYSLYDAQPSNHGFK